ncbi:anthranilate synthase [Helicobacter pylori]|nr:anthranilate synthase [Helicobacter pylori]
MLLNLSHPIFLITRKKDNRNKHYASGLKTLKNLI